ncbi:uncharacterized protein LOC112568893 isoform X2 [Pomacea canaliculata]|uniref:uncharacterized protein LOC112568893 isoform X2 n=1 Tax=Pomacea canaliculata TaxID=400727 RepID=UPI000D737C82|nr:uncharacterized protein LOC112568893 isoform X2 [Pomacea canaliculata]
MRAHREGKFLMFLVSLSLTQANITSSCGTTDSYLEVQEGKKDNTFTCTGLSANDIVTWNLRENDIFSTNPDLGYCLPRLSNGSFPPCEMPYYPYFKPSRLSDDAGIMIVNSSSSSASTFFDRGRIVCSILRSTSAGCRLDYIYSAENISCTVQFSNDFWSMLGQCDIKKTRSSQKRYRCEWIQTKESPREEILIANTSMTVAPSVGNYVTGWCNITSYLPPVGQYTYSVTLVPGEVTINASFVGNNKIVRPSSKPIHNCPQYIPEGDNLSCTCTLSDLGSPPGVLQWNTTGSAELRLTSVQAGNTGTHTCQLWWNNTVVQSVEYNFTVTYGPKTVTAVVLSSQPFDTNGLQDIGLNCSVSGSNPPSTISWIRSDNKRVLCNTQLCTLTPRPPDDDGLKIECLATNPVTNRTNSSSVTLALNYPPTSPPVITGNPTLHEGQPVYEGDSLTLTCTVRGGKPSNATVITFTCPNRTDTPDSSFNSSSVTSSLTFDPVTSYNHGNCSCTAAWKSYDWYKQKSNWNIDVYTSPSIPVIFPLSDIPGRPAYPFMAGTSGRLGCRSNQTGRPEATYSWPVPATGQASGSNLTFYNLSREDNGRTVKCRASNDYTENRRPVDDATLVLQVYYEPVVSFTRFSDGNDCIEVSSLPDYKQCVVTEGQRIHINCTADSNPSPLSFRWLSQNKDVYSNSSELLITSADHTIHNGDYNCTVVTKQMNNDSRLPLTSFAILTVIVGYSPSVLNFSINDMDNMTVNVRENSSVDIKCLCNGRPAPSIQLINGTEHFLIQSQPTEDIVINEQSWWVNFTIDQVPCEASGVYRCDVNNSLGQDSQSRTLLVYCAPRGTFGDKNINTTSGKGELTVRMTAYPTPMVKKIIFLGHGSSDGELVKENNIYVECSASSLAPAAVTCNVTVINIGNSDEGFYRIVFSNGFGDMPFTFFVKVSDQASQVKSKDNNIPAIIGGVFAVLVVVVIVIITVFLVQRHRRNGGLSQSRHDHHPNVNQRKTADDGVEMINNDTYAGPEAFASLAMNSDSAYENVAFENTQGDHVNTSGNNSKQEKNDITVQRNKDGLIYSSLDFDEAKSAKPPPPKHEETEYISIDLKKTKLLQHELNSN